MTIPSKHCLQIIKEIVTRQPALWFNLTWPLELVYMAFVIHV